MGRNGHLSLNRRVPGRDDSGSIGHNLDAIGPSKQGACCERLAVGRGIVKGERALSYAGRCVAGTGGGNSLALCRLLTASTRAATCLRACSGVPVESAVTV